jgi:FixJ family two-component response regulator
MIFLVDDDRGVLTALIRLLQAAGYRTEVYTSTEKFIDEHDPSTPGCVVLDLSMPRLDGQNVQELFAQQEIDRPIIFLTGNGSVTASVQAMKAGAADFLLKPVHKAELLDAIKRAAELDRACAERRAIRSLLGRLSSREMEVLTQVVAGRQSKQIAHDLGITEKTIKAHRSRVLKKLGVKHPALLVRMVDKVS